MLKVVNIILFYILFVLSTVYGSIDDQYLLDHNSAYSNTSIKPSQLMADNQFHQDQNKDRSIIPLVDSAFQAIFSHSKTGNLPN